MGLGPRRVPGVGFFRPPARLGHQRPQRLLDDVFDDGVGRVIAAGGLALALVRGQIQFARRFRLDGLGLAALAGRQPRLLAAAPHGDQRFGGDADLIFQQPLVDGAELAHAQRAIVNRLIAGETALVVGLAPPGQIVERPDEVAVADELLLQEGVALRVEQAAVIAGHAQEGVQVAVVAVDDGEQLGQVAPMPPGHRRLAIDGVVVHLPRRDLGQFTQAALDVGRVAHGQQAAALAKEEEQQPVEQQQAVAIDGVAVGRVVGVQPVGRRGKETDDELFQGLVGVVAQVAFQGDGVGAAAAQHVVEAARAGRAGAESVLAEEDGEVVDHGQGLPLVGRGQGVEQIDLEEDVELVAGVALHEPPDAAVGDDAPMDAGRLQVVVDLEHGVVVVEGGRAGRLLAQVDRPGLDLTDGQGVAGVFVGALVGHGGAAGVVVGKENVVGLLDAPVEAGHGGLRLPDVAELAEDGLDPALLKLGLAIGRQLGLLLGIERPQKGQQAGRARLGLLPDRLAAQNLLQIVIGEEAVVAVALAQSERQLPRVAHVSVPPTPAINKCSAVTRSVCPVLACMSISSRRR